MTGGLRDGDHVQAYCVRCGQMTTHVVTGDGGHAVCTAAH